MFKKKFKVSQSHALSGKDKKQLVAEMSKKNNNMDPQLVKAFVDDGNFDGASLTLEKIQGSKTIIYSRNKVPLLFSTSSDPLYYPSLYLLLQMDSLVSLRVFMKKGVEQFVLNGADLMWPGVAAISQEEFKANELALVMSMNRKVVGQDGAVAWEYSPVAIGKTITNGWPAEAKGKAIQIEHHFFDQLWEYGPKKIPASLDLQSSEPAEPQEDIENHLQAKGLALLEEQKVSEEQKQNEEQKEEEGLQQEEMKQSEQDVANNSGSEEEEEQKNEEQPGIPQEQVDRIQTEICFKALLESVKQKDLPLEPSEFLRWHFSPYYCEQQPQVQLRQSSFKKIGRLLEEMSKLPQGFLAYSQPKGIKHKLITGINWKSPAVQSFKFEYTIRKQKKKDEAEEGKGEGEGEGGYPKVAIEEVFALGQRLQQLQRMIKSEDERWKAQYFKQADVKEMVNEYIIENELYDFCQKGEVRLDPYLNQLLPKSSSSSAIPKDQLFKSLQSHLAPHYTVTSLDVSQVTKAPTSHTLKGQVPSVELLAQRVKNKKATMIRGLELFQIDLEELADYLKGKCSCSVTVQEDLARKGLMVQVQGNQLTVIEEVLVDRYKIPKKYITQINKIAGKKKK